jgi:hypothetical protein
VKRSDGQTLLTVAVDQNLLEAIDAKRRHENRSAFVRRVICEHLNIDLALSAAPDRTGKGGRPKAGSPGTKPHDKLPQTVGISSRPVKAPAGKATAAPKKKPALAPVPGTGTPDGNTKAG